jgi:hypothetical protein
VYANTIARIGNEKKIIAEHDNYLLYKLLNFQQILGGICTKGVIVVAMRGKMNENGFVF